MKRTTASARAFSRRQFVTGAAAAAGLGWLPSWAQEKFPSKPIEVVTHSGAGGGTDITARMMMVHAPGVFGTELVVANRVGGSGAAALAYAPEPPARRLHDPARDAVAPAHHPAGQVAGEIRRVRRARARHRRSAGADGRQVQPVQDGAGAARRRQDAQAEGGRDAHRQRRPPLAPGLRAQGGAAGAHRGSLPRRRRHRDQRRERQPRCRHAQLRGGRVADQGGRCARAAGADPAADEDPARRAHARRSSASTPTTPRCAASSR